MKAKTLTVITLLAVLALTLSGPATGLARQSASSPADSQNIAIASNSYFDDFSTYPVGSVPSGWTQYGTSAIVPTVVNFMGTGPAFQRLDFPAYTAQSTSKWLIRDGFTWATVTASVKINFQTASDGAGLVLAWVDNNNFIAVLPNPFWDEIVVWEFVNGQIRSAQGTGRYAVPIQTGQDYWLKAITRVSSTGDRQVDVWWSTDGSNYTHKLTATGLANLTGQAGVGTYQFLSHTLFDDFSLTGEIFIPPSNDDFDHAAALDEPPPNGWVNQVLQTDTNSATVAPDDPDMGCGAGVNSHTIWYKLTPSYYGRVRLRTYSELPAGNSTYDTVLAVFTGQRGSLQRIACNDDAPGHGTLSELTFEAEAGQMYYIEVASYGNSPGGTLSLFYNYQVSPKAWTLMFYIAANNNVDKFLLQERESLRLAARNLNVNVVALWDDNMDLFGSKYMVFAPWGVQEISKPELNTGDPQTLRDFVTWAMQEYPANHYALIISNHGQGFSGTSIDGFSHGDWLTVKETYQALLGIYPRLDIIYMHACLMATLDSAYQLADQADYYIASESKVWAPIRYDYFITGMPEHRTEVSAIRSDTSPTELALSMAESYAYQWKFTPQGRTPSTISVIKLSEITDVAVAASDLAGLLKNRMGTVKTALNSIWEDVQRFDESWPQWEINTADRAADLYHFASLVSQRISDADIQGAAWNLRNKISAAVLFNEAWSGYPSGGGNAYWYHGDAHGISVFLPSGKKQCYYTGDWLDFAYGTDWGCQGATSIVGSSWITGTPFEWGPMLVEYFNQTNPSAPEELNPPEPVPLLTYHNVYLNVYLPLVLRSFGATPPPTPTPTPTPPPTPTPTPTPPPSGPSIRVEPTSGTFGTQFTIYGSGFTPGESVQQWVITPSGDRFDDPTPGTVDSQGNYTSWVRINLGPTGTYTLYARGNQSQQTVSAQFQITSSTGGLGTSRTINVLWK